MKAVDITTEQMKARIARYADYGKRAATDGGVREKYWGGRMVALMGHAGSRGRLSGAILSAPTRSCIGYWELAREAKSLPYFNADCLEYVLCLEGSVEVRFGPDLKHSITLGRFDLVSLPVGVLHTVENRASGTTRLVAVLSGDESTGYTASFATPPDTALQAQALEAAAIVFGGRGREASPEEIEARTTRFDLLVPYKKSLAASSGIPSDATEWLTASSVFPLLVPEGYTGRSKSAPLKGLPGLCLAMAECSPGDGPLPHAHFNTQESFFVLEGQFDMLCGFRGEHCVPAGPFDLVSMPVGVMRTFANTGTVPARLFGIIQGTKDMVDVVGYAQDVGEEVERRYGPKVVDAFHKENVVFTAQPG